MIECTGLNGIEAISVIDDIAEPFIEANYDLSKIAYLGESVL